MQRNDIAGSIEFFRWSDRFHTIRFNGRSRTESIECIDFHSETFCDTGHIATYVAVCVDSQFLSFQFCSRCSVIEVADSHYHHSESQFGNGTGVLPRCIHHTNIMSCRSSQVDVIVTGSGTNHYLQLLGGIQHFGIDHVTADNDCIHILDCLQQFGLFTVFFQQDQFIACPFHYFADTFHSYRCERFICCY